MERGGCVYIMSNFKRTVLYTGVTSNLQARVQEHKNCVFPNSFTSKYKCFYLVYYEVFGSIEEAIDREKQIKGWKRFKKDALVLSMNRDLSDLYEDIKKW